MARDTTRGGKASGRFVLRAGAPLHARLRDAARDAGLSLNEYCVERLSAAGAGGHPPDAAAAIAWADAAFTGSLVAMAVYGSWARGAAAADSDVDLLVVIDPARPLRRDLYRRCDEASLTWDGHVVEPHLVNLPPRGEIRGGLWPEIALDAIVLVDRDYALSRHLVAVRRAIADGRLVRRTAHGQPYWTTSEAA